MPRTCLACSSPDRTAIDVALASSEPLRNIAERVSISPAALFRHRSHVAGAIVKASEKREENLGESLLDEMRRVQRKAWELLGKTESEGDHRGSIVALREVRECLESLGDMLSRAAVQGAGPLSQIATDELKTELASRGEQLEVILTVRNIGSEPLATPASSHSEQWGNSGGE